MSGKLCLVHPGRDCCADDGGAVLVSDVVLYDEDRPDSSCSEPTTGLRSA